MVGVMVMVGVRVRVWVRVRVRVRVRCLRDLGDEDQRALAAHRVVAGMEAVSPGQG